MLPSLNRVEIIIKSNKILSFPAKPSHSGRRDPHRHYGQPSPVTTGWDAVEREASERQAKPGGR